MNKISESEVKNFKDWDCGKDLQNDFVCGDKINRNSYYICDECLIDLKIRKEKIKSIKQEIRYKQKNKRNSVIALRLEYNRIIDSLKNKITELENGRD